MKISNPRSATDLMATALSFGNYDFAAALADVIDNSSDAKTIWVEINFGLMSEDVVVRVLDNSEGMVRGNFLAALRPSSTNPEVYRESDDLGRFSWGLKTASFSQARVLTVLFWCGCSTGAARWDSEDWGIDILEGKEALYLSDVDSGTPSGTGVIWSCCGRLIGPDLSPSNDGSLTHLVERSSIEESGCCRQTHSYPVSHESTMIQ